MNQERGASKHEIANILLGLITPAVLRSLILMGVIPIGFYVYLISIL